MITEPHWRRIGFRHHHGICLPLFSLHTKTRGRGDFSDLLAFIDWSKEVGFDCLMLLPLNDSGDDPSPYNPISSCALDPVYIHIPHLVLAPNLTKGEIRALKLEALKQEFSREKPREVEQFLGQNPWLEPYIRFHNAGDWMAFVQWRAFQQLRHAKKHAEKQGILLKGDIPILVSPQSVDVWAYPHLFNQNYSAGAPPDLYNPQGQTWGFPLFHWEEMRKAHFVWWKERLHVAEQFFHIYRIDHVVGFFRIWAIPKGEPAAHGHFEPEHPQLWEGQGREILRMMVEATHMLPMAEDLGTLPECTRPVLRELGICGTKVMRWQKQSPAEYEPMSMTTISTPDMEPLQLWWRNHPDAGKQFAQERGWHYDPELHPWQRHEILFEAHHSASLFHINLLQEYLALFPALVSHNPAEERMNLPGTINPTNWLYRFKPDVEEIIAHQGLKDQILKILR
jgi:4-alpha-glucanotransferase